MLVSRACTDVKTALTRYLTLTPLIVRTYDVATVHEQTSYVCGHAYQGLGLNTLLYIAILWAPPFMTKDSQGLFHKCLMLVESISGAFQSLHPTID